MTDILMYKVSRIWTRADIDESGRVIPGLSTVRVVAENYDRNGRSFYQETIYKDGEEVSYDTRTGYVAGYSDPINGYPGYPKGYGFPLV